MKLEGIEMIEMWDDRIRIWRVIDRVKWLVEFNKTKIKKNIYIIFYLDDKMK